jgi:uncharacterized membrane protein
MPCIEEHIEIAAAPSSVFRFCHDFTRWPEWNERIVSVEMLSPQPVRRGALFSIDAGRGGRYLFSWDAEYVEFQFPQQSVLRVVDAAPSSPFKTGTESWQYSSTGGGTRFTLVWDYQLRNLIARIADALGRRAATRRDIRRSLINLKKLIETG